jgi:hypothetical protein
MANWAREKIRSALLGKQKSAEHRANLWANRQGWTHSDGSRRKISEGLLRASREGRRLGPPVGWKHSEESKQKMSASGKGKSKTP